MYLHTQYNICDVHEREVPGKYSESGDTAVSRVIRQDCRLHIEVVAGHRRSVRRPGRRLLTTTNINLQQVAR